MLCRDNSTYTGSLASFSLSCVKISLAHSRTLVVLFTWSNLTIIYSTWKHITSTVLLKTLRYVCQQFYKRNRKPTDLIAPFQNVSFSVQKLMVQIDELIDPVLSHMIGQFFRLVPRKWLSFRQQTHRGARLCHSFPLWIYSFNHWSTTPRICKQRDMYAFHSFFLKKKKDPPERQAHGTSSSNGTPAPSTRTVQKNRRNRLVIDN